MSTYASGYNQGEINLGVAGAGSFGNVIQVPFASMAGAGATGPVYFLQYGIPVDLFGNAAGDWIVTPGVPGVSSGTLSSATRTAGAWIGSVFLQQGPSAGIPRAFFSGFHNAVGVTGGAHSFQGNNYRAQLSLYFGGLTPGLALSYRIAWNGNTPLTLNPSGAVILFST